MSDIQIFIQDKDNEGEWRDIDEGLLDLSLHDAKVRATAIDDFAEKIIDSIDGGFMYQFKYFPAITIRELAEQLKAGVDNGT